MLNRSVVKRCKVEGAIVAYDACEALIQRRKIFQRRGIIAAIVYDDDIELAGIVGLQKSFEAHFEEVETVSGRHDQADCRISGFVIVRLR